MVTVTREIKDSKNKTHSTSKEKQLQDWLTQIVLCKCEV